MKRASSGFWPGGLVRLQGELAKEEAARLAELETRLRAATQPAQKAEIMARIVKARAEFRQRRKNARASLFARS